MPWSVFTLYFIWMIFFVGWLTMRGAVWLAERSEGRATPWLRWSATLCCLYSGSRCHVPVWFVVCRLAFEINRPVFDRLAQQELVSPKSRLAGLKAGVYEVESVEYRRIDPQDPEEIIIYLAPFGHHEGFEYCPKCQPGGFSRRRDLGGGWYTLAEYSA